MATQAKTMIPSLTSSVDELHRLYRAAAPELRLIEQREKTIPPKIPLFDRLEQAASMINGYASWVGRSRQPQADEARSALFAVDFDDLLADVHGFPKLTAYVEALRELRDNTSRGLRLS